MEKHQKTKSEIWDPEIFWKKKRWFETKYSPKKEVRAKKAKYTFKVTSCTLLTPYRHLLDTSPYFPDNFDVPWPLGKSVWVLLYSYIDFSMLPVGGGWFLNKIKALCGSVLQVGTCQILSLAENPRCSRVWQYVCMYSGYTPWLLRFLVATLIDLA